MRIGKKLLRCLQIFSFGLMASILATEANAGLLTIRPITLVPGAAFNMTVTGTITTASSTSNISDWNVKVTTFERLAHYAPSNTALLTADGLASDGVHLTLPTSPDGSQDGGALLFRSPNPFQDFGVSLADFTGANVAGGQALYMTGSAFDFLDLLQPDATNYRLANVAAGNLYDLVPLVFPGGVLVSGTIRTNGATGILNSGNISDWDIYVDQITEDIFNSFNSTLVASGLSLTSGGELAVTNPDGYLNFSKGFAGGHPFQVQLADFTGPAPGGQAGYYRGPLSVDTIPLRAPRGAWRVTGTGAIGVPEPHSLALFATGVLVFAATGVRRRRTAKASRRMPA